MDKTMKSHRYRSGAYALWACLIALHGCAAGVDTADDGSSGAASLEAPLVAEESAATQGADADRAAVDGAGIKVEALQAEREVSTESLFAPAVAAEHPYCSAQDGGYDWRATTDQCKKCVDFWKPFARSFCAGAGGLLCYQCINNCDTEGPFRGIRFSCVQ